MARSAKSQTLQSYVVRTTIGVLQQNIGYMRFGTTGPTEELKFIGCSQADF